MQRPSFRDLTASQQQIFGNGVGPFWLPSGLRQLITRTASWFFQGASWRHHDFGYVVGGDRWDRARCDWKFYSAMLRDAVKQKHANKVFTACAINLVAVPLAILIATIFFVAVRCGGQFGSFEYRDHYASLNQILAVYHR